MDVLAGKRIVAIRERGVPVSTILLLPSVAFTHGGGQRRHTSAVRADARENRESRFAAET